MSHDYDWKAGPKGGTLVDLETYATVRMVGGSEPIAGQRFTPRTSPYRPGAMVPAQAFDGPLLIGLEVIYPATSTYTNKATVEKALFGEKSLATLRRTVPTHGTIEAYVRVLNVVPSQNRFSYVYTLLAHEGTWRSTSQTTDSTSPVANSGNAAVWDAVVDIDTSASGTDVVVTMTADGATISIDGATPTGGVRVDFGTGLVTELNGGTDYGEKVSFGKPYGLLLEPGDNAFSTSGSPSEVTFKFYPRFR